MTLLRSDRQVIALSRVLVNYAATLDWCGGRVKSERTIFGIWCYTVEFLLDDGSLSFFVYCIFERFTLLFYFLLFFVKLHSTIAACLNNFFIMFDIKILFVKPFLHAAEKISYAERNFVSLGKFFNVKNF